MAHSKKWQAASFLLKQLGMSSLISKLYPIAMSQLHSGISREKLDLLRSLFILEINHKRNFIRIGDQHDGGYLLVNDLLPTDVCLSFGIGSNYTFDAEIANHCEKVLMFDHTIPEPQLKSNNMFFYSRGVSNVRSEDFVTLEEVISEIPKSNDIILKIDVEGAEWRVLNNTKDELLSRCRQIVAEFHNLHQIGTDDFFKEVVASLQLLAVNHSLVNVHINNWAKCDIVQGILFPDVIEVTYIRKPDGNNALDKAQYLTSEKNTPNNPTRSDAEFSFISKVSF
jgi:hypothetical protein